MTGLRSSTDQNVFLVHDHLAQRGGAERVVQTMSDAFGGCPIHTSVFSPDRTYGSFSGYDVRDMWFSQLPFIRSNHRWAFPLMAPGFRRLRSKAPVTLASTAGWAHGVRCTGRKVILWHSPPRWLYQQAEYLAPNSAVARAVGVMAPALRRWDRSAVESADRHLAVSTEIANRLQRIYDIEAEVLHPPMMLHAEPEPVDGLPGDFLLIVSRLMSYKNIHYVARAMQQLPHKNLVVVGSGPFREHLMAIAPRNMHFVEAITDGQLIGLYQRCEALIAAAYEDFGLTPIEAAAQGKPTVAFRAGGFLDTVEHGHTGIFFDTLDSAEIVAAIEKCVSTTWDEGLLRAHVERFSVERFQERLHQIVDEEVKLS